MLACPICGRLVSINHFDPRGFEDDIYGVNVRGLGRGKGFEVTDRFSLLDDPWVVGLIADRCHRVLNLIERGSASPPGEVGKLRATLQQTLDRLKQTQRLVAEQEADLATQEQAIHLQETVTERLRRQVDELEAPSDDDDEDDLEEKMQEILDRINYNANSDFDNLSDAVDFLIEM